MTLSKLGKRIKIKKRIRTNLSGTNEAPRMSVFRSNKQIYVQLVNDLEGKTMVAASSLNKEIAESQSTNKIEQAKKVGKFVAEKALAAGIKSVVFDRNGYQYHGRIRSLAEAAREGGLKF